MAEQYGPSTNNPPTDRLLTTTKAQKKYPGDGRENGRKATGCSDAKRGIVSEHPDQDTNEYRQECDGDDHVHQCRDIELPESPQSLLHG